MSEIRTKVSGAVVGNQYLNCFVCDSLRPRADFINPFTLCAKLLCSTMNFYTLKKLLKSWAQSVRGLERKWVYEINPSLHFKFCNRFSSRLPPQLRCHRVSHSRGPNLFKLSCNHHLAKKFASPTAPSTVWQFDDQPERSAHGSFGSLKSTPTPSFTSPASTAKSQG